MAFYHLEPPSGGWGVQVAGGQGLLLPFPSGGAPHVAECRIT